MVRREAFKDYLDRRFPGLENEKVKNLLGEVWEHAEMNMWAHFQNRHRESNYVAEVLADFANAGDFSENKNLASQILRKHRTLQQGIMRAFMEVILQWAELGEDKYDLRNEATVRLAKRIKNEMGEDIHLPFI